MINQAKSLLDQFMTPGADGKSPDLSNILSQSGLGGALSGGGATLAKGAAAGGLVGLLLGGKKSRKLIGSAAKLGGVALVGGLAYKAYQDWQNGQKPVAPDAPVTLPKPDGTAFLPDTPEAAEDLSSRLVRVMVAAAKADGHVTADERARITAQLPALGLGDEARALIEGELARPLDLDAIAALAHSPEEAAEVYAAALLTVDPEGAAEKGFLAMLAARLKLDPQLVAHLHANAAAVTEA